MPIEIESLRAELPEGASGTSLAPGAYFSGLARSSKDRRKPELLAGRGSQRTCQHAAGRSRNPLQTLQRGSIPSSDLRTSHSIRYRSSRRNSTAVRPRIFFRTISTSTSGVERSVRAFISSLPSVASPAIDCRTGCAYSGLILRTLHGCRLRYHHAERFFWIPRWPTPTPGFHGSEIELGTVLRLSSRRSVCCWSDLAPNDSVPCPKARVGVTG